MQGSNLEDSCGRWTKLTEIDAVDLSTVHGHILVITSAGFITYEYRNGLANLLGLQGLIENMDQTKALSCWMPQSCAAAHRLRVPGGDSKLGMGSRVCASNETHARITSGNHKIFNARNHLPKLGDMRDLKRGLIDAGVL